MRFGGRRIIDSDITSMDGEPVQPVNALGSIFNRPHGDKGKTSRPPGLYRINLRYVLWRDSNDAWSTHSLIIHDNNLFNFSMSAEFILKVPFGRADRQTKYSQDVCRFYFGENEWGLRWRFGGNGVPASRIWRRGWSYSIGVESHPVMCSAIIPVKFLDRMKDYDMICRCLIYPFALSTELPGQRIRTEWLFAQKGAKDVCKHCRWQKAKKRMRDRKRLWSNPCRTPLLK